MQLLDICIRGEKAEFDNCLHRGCKKEVIMTFHLFTLQFSPFSAIVYDINLAHICQSN